MNYYELVKWAKDNNKDVNLVISGQIKILENDITYWKESFDKSPDGINALFCQTQIDEAYKDISYLQHRRYDPTSKILSH